MRSKLRSLYKELKKLEYENNEINFQYYNKKTAIEKKIFNWKYENDPVFKDKIDTERVNDNDKAISGL
jgi:hypothetical protein